MASPAWLSQETQPSAPQVPTSSPFTGGASGALQNSSSVAIPAVGSSSNSSVGPPSHSKDEPTQAASAPPMGYTVPSSSSFSYNASQFASSSSSSVSTCHFLLASVYVLLY